MTFRYTNFGVMLTSDVLSEFHKVTPSTRIDIALIYLYAHFLS